MKWATQKAFTIVELLIVIVVIAILAAITVVAYTGIQNTAHDSAVQSDLRNTAVKMRLFRAEHAGIYPTNTSELATVGLSFSKGSYYTENKANVYYCLSADNSHYAFVSQSKSGKAFQFDSGSGQVKDRAPVGNWSPTTANWPGTCSSVESDTSYTNAGQITAMSYGSWESWAN